MEPELPGARVFRLEAVAHDVRPDAPGGAVLRDLLEEIAVRIEEERETGSERVHLEPRIDAVLDVLDSVPQRERKLLCSGGARFTNVVPADGNRVPARHALGAERKDVGDEPHRLARGID